MLRLARYALGSFTPALRRLGTFPAVSDSEDEQPLPFEQAATEPVHENLLLKEKRFFDIVRTKVVAGKGGDGCFTFRRMRGVRRAFPAGGNGAPGGNVCIEASEQCHFLSAPPIIEAPGGGNGMGKDMDGRRGRDAILKVPLGTLVYQTASHEKRRLLFDLDTPQRVIVANGGKGGRGNKMYSSITDQEKGILGESKQLLLELKVIADIGFVGYPNAGKTSLLAALTRACPKIASYPFTTLRPYIGMLNFVDGFKMTVADMPGLIEGAHENKGLGHDFLKHIQRTKAVVYVMDGTKDVEGDLIVLFRELRLFDEKLVRKPYAVIVNKSDIMDESDKKKVDDLKVQNFRSLVENLRPKVKKSTADYEIIFSDTATDDKK